MAAALVHRLTDLRSPWTRLAWSLAVAVLCVAGTVSLTPGGLDALGWALLAVPALALVLLPYAFVPGAALSAAAPLVFYALGYRSIFAAAPAMVVVFAASRRGRGAYAVAVTAVLCLGAYAVGVTRGLAPGEALEGPSWILGWMLAAAAGGDVVRRRARLLDEERRRADVAAQRGAEQERLRIARELHDSLTHSISVINVQAGVAAHLADREPERIPEALAAIQEAGADAMRELRSTVEVLRRIAPGGDPADEPGPSLDRLPGLLEAGRATGAVFHVKRGAGTHARDLPAEVDRAAFRIVQESLSNAARHAPGAPVRLTITREREHLEITVRNGPGGTPKDGGTGMGLIGMRERADMVGGRLDAGPEEGGGGFRVRALLPLVRNEIRR